MEQIFEKKRGRWTNKINANIKIEDSIISIIRKREPITRGELHKLTKIPRTTLYDYIVGLISNEVIERVYIPTRRRGRPAVFYKIKK